MRCVKCKGIGLVSVKKNKCQFCDGLGKYVLQEETLFCHNCKGSGKMPINNFEECIMCFGSGIKVKTPTTKYI